MLKRSWADLSLFTSSSVVKCGDILAPVFYRKSNRPTGCSTNAEAQVSKPTTSGQAGKGAIPTAEHKSSGDCFFGDQIKGPIPTAESTAIIRSRRALSINDRVRSLMHRQ